MYGNRTGSGPIYPRFNAAMTRDPGWVRVWAECGPGWDRLHVDDLPDLAADYGFPEYVWVS